MDDSLLQRLKLLVLSVIGVSPDALLVFLGLGCYLATCLIARQPLTWAWALAPGICLSMLLEALEIWDYYGAEGLAKTRGKHMVGILMHHSKDVLVANLAPVLVFCTAVLLPRFLQD